MTLPRRVVLMNGIHAIGCVCVLALAAGTWWGVIEPLQQRSVELPKLRKSLDRASERCAELIRYNQELSARLVTGSRAVRAEEARGLLGETELASIIAGKCADAKVALHAIEPAVPTDKSDVAQREMLVRGRGRFPAFHQVLAALESESAYLQVLSVSIEGPTPPLETDCKLTWVVRCQAPTASTLLTGESL